MLLPTIAHESIVTCFDYWDDGLQKGMRHLNDLYTHVEKFPLNQRDQAYAKGSELAAQGKRVCLTVSSDSYALWISLRE